MAVYKNNKALTENSIRRMSLQELAELNKSVRAKGIEEVKQQLAEIIIGSLKKQKRLH